MKAPFMRNPYNYDMNEAGDQSGLACKDATRTKQNFAEEVDINTIVKRFNLTGQLPTNARMPTYADYEGIFDFHSAMNAIVDAETSFMSLPATVRARFHNDPGEFVDFCLNDDNRAEAEKMGLVAPRPAPLDPNPPQATPLPDKGKDAPKGSVKPPKGGDE